MWEVCRNCVLEKALSDCGEQEPRELADRYRCAVRELVRDFPEDGTAPELAFHVKQLQKEIFHRTPLDFTGIKRHFNELLMSFEEEIKEKIRAADDPLLCAIQYAMIGNYIDYAAFQSVEEATLLALLKKAGSIRLNEDVLANLRESVRGAGKLVYVTDNCGEIVLDKLLIEEILRMNPELSVTALVRGSSEGNDATMEDAAEVGLPSVCRVMGNGAPIDATVMRYLSVEARSLLRESDFIIAKGQANYESLYGLGLHVFYLLMCKCDFFTERFQVPKYSGVLTEETGRL